MGFKRFLLLGAMALLLVGCTDDETGVIFETASVEGIWVLSFTNASAATFTGCSGDLARSEGITLDRGLASCTLDDPEVSQTGSLFIIQPIPFACTDGSSGTFTGRGSVVGTSVTGRFQWAPDGLGWVESDLFTGVLSGSTLALELTEIDVTGTIEGSCRVDPALEGSATIGPAPAPSRLPGARGPAPILAPPR